MHHHAISARRHGSIGSFGQYVIFPHPRKGHDALAAWIHSKKYFYSSLHALAQHYQPDSPDLYVQKLSSLSHISPDTKIKDLTQEELDRLLRSIEKLCGFVPSGNEAFSLLPKKERDRLIIFTFGGGSFIAPGKAHPDSHNFASCSDPVCFFAAPNLRFLALQRYFGSKEGFNEQEVIRQLALGDAMLDLESVDEIAIDQYARQRENYYEKKFSELKNLTILDPDPHYLHQFRSTCYQSTIQMIIKRYQHHD